MSFYYHMIAICLLHLADSVILNDFFLFSPLFFSFFYSLSEEFEIYIEKVKAINPKLFEGEGLCKGSLGFYMVEKLTRLHLFSLIYSILRL